MAFRAESNLCIKRQCISGMDLCTATRQSARSLTSRRACCYRYSWRIKNASRGTTNRMTNIVNIPPKSALKLFSTLRKRGAMWTLKKACILHFSFLCIKQIYIIVGEKTAQSRQQRIFITLLGRNTVYIQPPGSLNFTWCSSVERRGNGENNLGWQRPLLPSEPKAIHANLVQVQGLVQATDLVSYRKLHHIIPL